MEMIITLGFSKSKESSNCIQIVSSSVNLCLLLSCVTQVVLRLLWSASFSLTQISYPPRSSFTSRLLQFWLGYLLPFLLPLYQTSDKFNVTSQKWPKISSTLTIQTYILLDKILQRKGFIHNRVTKIVA